MQGHGLGDTGLPVPHPTPVQASLSSGDTREFLQPALSSRCSGLVAKSSPQPMTKEVENEVHQLPHLRVEQPQSCPTTLLQVPSGIEPHLLNDVPLGSSILPPPLRPEITS